MQQFRLTYFLFAQTESPEKEKGNEKIEIDWNILILKKNNAPQTSYIKRMTIKKLCFDRILNQSVKSEIKRSRKEQNKRKETKNKKRYLKLVPMPFDKVSVVKVLGAMQRLRRCDVSEHFIKHQNVWRWQHLSRHGAFTLQNWKKGR